jgi:hypothetical protein
MSVRLELYNGPNLSLSLRTSGLQLENADPSNGHTRSIEASGNPAFSTYIYISVFEVPQPTTFSKHYPPVITPN